jgi:hypothetical protein
VLTPASRVGEHHRTAPVGGVEHLRAQHLGGAARGDHAAVEHQQPLVAGVESGEVVVDHHHRGAGLGDAHELAVDDACRGGVEARIGLVEQQDRGLLRQRAGQEGALLLATGELGDAHAGEVGHPHPGQGRLDGGVVLPPQPPDRAAVGVAAHGDHVAHLGRMLPVDLGPLRQVGDATAGPGGGAPLDLDAPPGGADQPDDALEQRRLARPVGADDPDPLTGPDVEVHALEGHAVAVAGAHAPHPQPRLPVRTPGRRARRAHGASPSTSAATFARIIPT